MPERKRTTKPTTYADSGVDISAMERAIGLFADKVRSTFRPEVISDIGAFGGLFAIDAARYQQPVLVASTDGVGTKSLISQSMEIHNTIGYDLVAHCTNDIAVTGAEPLFFLDCITVDKVVEETIAQIVEGMVVACKEAGCALIGGEIAEHPGHLASGTYDLSGTCIGVVERDAIIDGSTVAPGDVVVGIESSGLQTNGYSMARKVLLEDMGHLLDDQPEELRGSIGEELLRPSILYAPALGDLTQSVRVNAMAHITGGGIQGNLSRVIPDGLQAVIQREAWEVPPIFRLIQRLGNVDEEEMFYVFNMGIGLVALISPDDANKALDLIRGRGHRAHEIGLIADAGDDDSKVKLL
ncbi:MAG: phosphoribosylformylglycinamidine cyclo-ligase [Actinobacteria bacterium]|nr:phosphoribosylformylglycinamidine cyclo-ligase [Actinomycetota bacterium]